jgi:hypothetical protein
MHQPRWAWLAGFGSTVLAGSPADFGKLIAGETEKWAKVIKFAGIKPVWWWASPRTIP